MARHLIRTWARLGLVVVTATAAAAAVMLLRRPSAETPSASLAFGCKPGDGHTYALQYASEGELFDDTLGLGGTSRTSPPTQRIVARVRGAMRTICIAQEGDAHTVAMSFAGLDGALTLPDGREHSAADLLSETTFVRRDRRGRIQSIRFPKAMPEVGRSMVRDMLALSQVTGPEAPASEWSAPEVDANGRFEAAYRVRAVDGDAVTLGKARRAAADAATLRSKALAPRAEPVGDGALGEVRVRHKDGGDVVSAVDVTSALALTLGSNTVGSTRGQLALHEHDNARADAAVLARLREELSDVERTLEPPADLAGSEVEARLKRRMHEKELEGDSWRTLVGRLDATEEDRTKVYLKLKALFFLYPETCAEAAQALSETKDPNATRFQLLSGALAAVGSKEAQQALREATRASVGKVAHERTLVGALGMLKTPTEETLRELSSMRDGNPTDEVRGSARLALGSLAASAPEQGKAIVAAEAASYRAATTSDERVLSLLALGNSGASDVLALAREALESSDPRVRAAAVAALRFVSESDAEAMLVAAARNDSVAAVRAEALHSLGYRVLGADAVDAACVLARLDAEENVRMAAVQLLSAELGRDGALEGVLEEIVKTERASGVRKAAELALLRHRAMAGK